MKVSDDGNQVTIRPLGRAGVFVNGNRLKERHPPHALGHGDRVVLGDNAGYVALFLDIPGGSILRVNP